MAVAFDATSESHTGTTGNASAASFTWDHTPVGTPRGVLVFTFVNANADDATGVTYGGTAMTAVSGGRAINAAGGEPGDCKAWFLGSSVPTTSPAAVVVSRNNNANVMYAIAVTVTAGANTEVAGVVLQENASAALAEVNVDDGSPGTNSVRFAGVNSGRNLLDPPGANSTALHDLDVGLRVNQAVRETTAGQGSRPVGVNSSLNSDDVAAVYLAIREAAGGSTDFDATGDLDAQASTIEGAASHGRASTGSLAVQAASASGSATLGRASTGALQAQASSVAGTVTISRAASGDLTAQVSTIDASGQNSGAPVQVGRLVVGGGASWEDFVKDVHAKRNLERELKEKKKELKKVEKKIRVEEKKAAKVPHPDGILANLHLLEARKVEIQERVQEIHDVLIIDWQSIEIDEDDAEFMSLQ